MLHYSKNRILKRNYLIHEPTHTHNARSISGTPTVGPTPLPTTLVPFSSQNFNGSKFDTRMARALTTKEQGIMDKFSNFKLETINANPVSFNSKGTMFNIKEPLVVKIGDTGALLVFGELQKSMGMEELRAWLEQRMKAEEEKKDFDSEKEIEGEEHEHSCGGTCGHDHGKVEAKDAMNDELPVGTAETEDPRVSEEDIKLIMDQASVSREKVVETLKKCDYDVVNAMVMLSKEE